MSTLTVLHPGAMGAPVAGEAVAAGHRVLWVPEGRSAASGERAEGAGLTRCERLGEALGVSDIVLSICPPHASEQVADAVAGHGFAGIYVEANAISPERMQRIAGRMPASCTVLDGMLSGPPPRDGRTVRFYLAGDAGARESVEAVFADTRILTRATGGGIGSASALKLAISSYQKVSRALAGVAHALAADHGVEDLLLAEAGAMNKDILDNPGYLPGVAARAWRWGPEMAEVADTLRAAGLPAELAEAAELVYSRWDQHKDQSPDLDTVLNTLHHRPKGSV
ncbi:phosphogluconate dehydrogenase [Streptomyces tsukubensis]|uniref:Phosphogluconate dehydrogenase n=1 Tax=Streptomyces tsukubensis (strain DSM 42081 / NBRC 108919 / NRRL 18488 / 9993) TaxID=1114943 RepID=A0A7G3UDR4_STRT9|nr:NAD(P)-dependent oxidoreductase [Streptomyces tsukubensis]AZK95393.1 phosphogluconate dehydrogenase [Streptomyces tsukubensis]QKM68557.1 phosphogluconate dehydrogenase [Streptomyces tsukubensis NRRL18488]TAI43365.1 NAD(P)-dependent oxidoreductase [Streptomyces tsukubensis]